jgi:DNA-binding transcriptional LysR family regulator
MGESTSTRIGTTAPFSAMSGRAILMEVAPSLIGRPPKSRLIVVSMVSSRPRIRHDQGDRRFQSHVLPPDELLAACAPSLELGRTGMIDIGRLAAYPLLLLESGYSIRRLFNAACRLADVEPNILLESRAPHTLLALAEAGQGVAIIPSLLRTDRYTLRIVRVTHRRKALQERFVIQWDKRRQMPPYAESFCEALAEYMREVLPITQPSENQMAAARKRAAMPASRGPKMFTKPG